MIAHLRRGWRPALFILLLGMLGLHADEGNAPVTDPALVGAHLHTLLQQSQFQETAEPPVNTHIEDLLSQWFRSIGVRFGEFKYASRMPAFESLLMSILVGFAVAILVYIMVRLTRRRGRMELESDEEITDQKTFRPPEDYDHEISAALGAGDWHTAYLAGWRQFLSRLEHRHLVDADRTQTNREYLAQLRGKSLPGPALPLLSGLVDAYDRFVYGRQAMAESDWAKFRQQIDEATLLLHLDDKVAVAMTGSAAI